MPADEAFEAAASVVDETAGREDGAKTPPGADRRAVGAGRRAAGAVGPRR